MVFNSLPFLVFISCFFGLYWMSSGRSRLWLCLGASYFFYGWWDARFVSLLLWSTVLDYFAGVWIEASDNQQVRKRWLVLSLVSNLGLLAVFKYFGFFAQSLQDSLSAFGWTLDWPTLNIILPVGISFYTFQTMSYTIDIYRGSLKAEKDFVRFATFVSFFPQLVAGPIVRASEFLPQLKSDRVFDAISAADGLGQCLLGFFKKMVIADSIAPVVDNVFAFPEAYSTPHVTIAIVLYAFQIYGDFSGYSDIAIGLARILGFEFPTNFRFPYFATSFSDFWTRWHITLSSWLRDYLYIPLGGNRGGKWFTYRNLMVTMLLGGLWHGANWTFVVWGALHGLYLVLQRELARFVRFDRSMPPVLSHLLLSPIIFAATCLTWVFFRSPDFETAAKVLGRLAALEGLSLGSIKDVVSVAKAAGLVSLLVFAEICVQFFDVRVYLHRWPALRVLAYSSLLWLIALFGTFGGGAFIYFQF